MAASTGELNCLYNVIKRYCNSQESLKLGAQSITLSRDEMVHVRTLLVSHLKENKVKLIKQLEEPKSAGDWNVVDYLVKYVSTPSEELTCSTHVFGQALQCHLQTCICRSTKHIHPLFFMGIGRRMKC
ncbi:hypothetical protein ACE6H2_024958 [Prunus campanulata]